MQSSSAKVGPGELECTCRSLHIQLSAREYWRAVASCAHMCVGGSTETLTDSGLTTESISCLLFSQCWSPLSLSCMSLPFWLFSLSWVCHWLFRHYSLDAYLPLRLRPESMEKLHCLRACVIRSLYHMYEPFASRVSRNPAIPDSTPSTLKNSRVSGITVEVGCLRCSFAVFSFWKKNSWCLES